MLPICVETGCRVTTALAELSDAGFFGKAPIEYGQNGTRNLCILLLLSVSLVGDTNQVPESSVGLSSCDLSLLISSELFQILPVERGVPRTEGASDWVFVMIVGAKSVVIFFY